MVYLIVGIDRSTLSPWHANVRGRDAAGAREAARDVAAEARPEPAPSSATEPPDLDQVVDYPRDARLKEATRTRREAEARVREAEGRLREAEGKLRDARRRERDLITKAREKAASAERG